MSNANRKKFSFLTGNHESVNNVMEVTSLVSRWFADRLMPLHINGIRFEAGKKPRVYVDYTPQLHNLGRAFTVTDDGERRSLLIKDGDYAVLVYWTNPPSSLCKSPIQEHDMTLSEAFSVMQRPPTLPEPTPARIPRYRRLLNWIGGAK